MKKDQRYRKMKGQSLVEMGLALPLFLLLVFSFIDLGRAIYYSSALGNAVREGARFASVTPNLDADSTARDLVVDKVTHYSIAVPIPAADVEVLITKWADADSDGENEWVDCGTGVDVIDSSTGCIYVTVYAPYLFDPITPFLEKAFGSPGNEIRLTTESTMLLTPYARQ